MKNRVAKQEWEILQRLCIKHALAQPNLKYFMETNTWKHIQKKRKPNKFSWGQDYSAQVESTKRSKPNIPKNNAST